MKNAVDMVRPFVGALEDCRIDNVQLFGGIGSRALEDPRTLILPADQLVVAPADLSLDQYREDGNLRDLDCLVMSVDDDEIEEVEAIAEASIGEGELELSVFGLRPMSKLAEQNRHPVLSLAKVNVADRYVTTDKIGRVTAVKKALFPFAVDMPVSTLETWRLQVGKDEGTLFPIPHPGATVLNYLTRSGSGLRPKDAQKVDKLAGNIADQAPEIIDWIVDGPGASQFDLARIFHTLREQRETAPALVVGGRLRVEPYQLSELTRHAAFMLSGRPRLLRGLVEAEHVKNRGVHRFESDDRVVTLWQRYIEPRTQGMLKNK